jgi:hypothetical protein
LKRNDYPRVEKTKVGAFVLRNLPPVMALALRRLPELLADDAPGIRGRLMGSPYPADPEATKHWEKYAGPDLEHLFRSARELVLKDVAGIAPEPRAPERSRIEIPASHLAAWISSLAAVRVALGSLHELKAEEMEESLPAVLVTTRDRAVLLVHLLGWVQGLLVEAGA